MSCRDLFLVLIAVCIVGAISCAQPKPEIVEVPATVVVEVAREVPVTVETEKEVVVTREVPVTVEVVRNVEVTRTVPVTVEVEKEVVVDREVPVTVEVEKEVVVDREVPVTVEVERTVLVEREVAREIVREVPVTVEVEKEVEIMRDVPVTVVVETEKPFNTTFRDVERVWDELDVDNNHWLTWSELCAGYEEGLDLEAHLIVMVWRHNWWVSEDEADFDLHRISRNWTNIEVCDDAAETLRFGPYE